MSDEAIDPPERLLEVSRLATYLADRVIRARTVQERVPDAHIYTLINAAIILDEYEIALPSSLGLIVDQLHDAEPTETEPEAEATPDKDVGRLAWLLRPFQGTKS